MDATRQVGIALADGTRAARGTPACVTAMVEARPTPGSMVSAYAPDAATVAVEAAAATSSGSPAAIAVDAPLAGSPTALASFLAEVAPLADHLVPVEVAADARATA